MTIGLIHVGVHTEIAIAWTLVKEHSGSVITSPKPAEPLDYPRLSPTIRVVLCIRNPERAKERRVVVCDPEPSLTLKQLTPRGLRRRGIKHESITS